MSAAPHLPQTGSPDSTPRSLQQYIDGQRVGAAHRWLLLVCALVMCVDSFDSFVVGKIAPALASGFHVTAASMTRVFVVQQVGLALGAFTATAMADRYGRQRMIAVSIGAFGILALMSARATNLDEFAALRGLSGVFLTGVLPMVIALIAESVPRRRRGTFVSIAFVAYSAGSAAGGFMAVWLLEHFGWQSVFTFGGLAPLALVPAVLLLVPESPMYLAETAASPDRIRATLRRFDAHVDIPDSAIRRQAPKDHRNRHHAMRMLLGSEHRRKTLIVWAAAFLSMGCIALLAAWLPTFFQEMAGVPIRRFALYSLIGFFGGMTGSLSSGWLLDRAPATSVAPAYYVGLAVSFLILGWMWTDATILLLGIVVYNLFQTGGQAILNVLLSDLYPTAVRSTGIGWAGGMGRVGGIVLPVFGGWALQHHFTMGLTMTTLTVVPLGVVACIFWLRGTVSSSSSHQLA